MRKFKRGCRGDLTEKVVIDYEATKNPAGRPNPVKLEDPPPSAFTTSKVPSVRSLSHWELQLLTPAVSPVSLIPLPCTCARSSHWYLLVPQVPYLVACRFSALERYSHSSLQKPGQELRAVS